MFQGVERPCELIFTNLGIGKTTWMKSREWCFKYAKGPANSICLQDVLKCDFVEFDEAMFQGVERPCKLTFCILGIEKRDLDEVAEVMFQVGVWPWELIICFWTS
jgi:hypothetical protein